MIKLYLIKDSLNVGQMVYFPCYFIDDFFQYLKSPNT